jgi:reversibly glycosylated polypeptide / UDP-arabinopyranose mutase
MRRSKNSVPVSLKCTVVIPTIREPSIKEFLGVWEKAFASAHVMVIEDNPTRTFDLSGYPQVTHYAWEDVDRDLGADNWIIPRRTDCIRSYGYWKAYQDHPDMVITLDDDCYPVDDGAHFVEKHWEALTRKAISEAWQETGEGGPTRGVPYFHRYREWPCLLNHGLWDHVPDFDAPTQLVHARFPQTFTPVNQTIPVGRYFPMCGMNLAFRPELIPALYFLLMGKGYQYDRFGDIWSGVLVKKICDHLGYAVKSGDPIVVHQRASNVWTNLRKEAPGLEVNEEFWQVIDGLCLSGRTVIECYQEIANSLTLEGQYWSALREAMLLWSGLFTKAEIPAGVSAPPRVDDKSFSPSRSALVS